MLEFGGRFSWQIPSVQGCGIYRVSRDRLVTRQVTLYSLGRFLMPAQGYKMEGLKHNLLSHFVSGFNAFLNNILVVKPNCSYSSRSFAYLHLSNSFELFAETSTVFVVVVLVFSFQKGVVGHWWQDSYMFLNVKWGLKESPPSRDPTRSESFRIPRTDRRA